MKFKHTCREKIKTKQFNYIAVEPSSDGPGVWPSASQQFVADGPGWTGMNRDGPGWTGKNREEPGRFVQKVRSYIPSMGQTRFEANIDHGLSRWSPGGVTVCPDGAPVAWRYVPMEPRWRDGVSR